jgi:hypothetical protein
MAKQASLFLPVGANDQYVTIVPADTTTLKTLFTANINDSDVKTINVASDDSASRIVKLWITRLAVDYLLGAITIPALSGSDGTAVSIDLINSTSIPSLPVDSAGKRYLPLQYGDVVKVSTTTTVTAAKTITFAALGQDY